MRVYHWFPCDVYIQGPSPVLTRYTSVPCRCWEDDWTSVRCRFLAGSKNVSLKINVAVTELALQYRCISCVLYIFELTDLFIYS